MNPLENRESITEIFFKTFNVPGLYIGVQAVFALLGCSKTFEDDGLKMDKEQEQAIKTLTGVVVDLGDRITHIVSIFDGYVLGSNIKHIPIAGRKITKFMEKMIKERGGKINTEDLYFATMDLKEKYEYLARDLVDEFAKYDKKQNVGGKLTQSSKFRKYEVIGKI